MLYEAKKKKQNDFKDQRQREINEVEKLKADDKFFIDTGIEEEDVEPSVKRLGLEEDEEFKAIIEKYKKQSEDFLASKKDETAAMMQKA